MLRLALLGAPGIALNGHSLLDQLAGRGLALVVYLAVTGQIHRRERLADLLWQDVSSAEALKKLRNLLPRIRPLLPSHLHVTRDTIAFDHSSPHWLDVDVLRTHLNPITEPMDIQVLEKALTLYHDDFLAGLSLRDAPQFEEWVVQEREELHRLALQGFHRVADYHLKHGDVSAGLSATRRLLTLEPWREEAHRQQMLLLAKQGDRTAALTQFTLCQRVLADEFGIEPAAETLLLYQQLRDNTYDTSRAAQTPIGATSTSGSASASSTSINWDEIPRPLRFYGREDELKTLEQWLTKDGCRLVGVFGMGGQGKSSLVAHWLRSRYARHASADASPDQTEPPEPGFARVLWCSLRPGLPLTQLLQEWLMVFSHAKPPTLPTRLERELSMLIYYLRQERCLLVLDGLEHVLPDGSINDAARDLHADYAKFLLWLASGDHQSCLLVISEQRPLAFTRWEEQSPAVRSLQLQGLCDAASRQLLGVYGLNVPACDALIWRYAGCPLALTVAAETTQELFAGKVERFLDARSWVNADLHSRLQRRFATLGAAEQSILLWLAVAQTPLTFDALCARLAAKPNKRVYLEACRVLLYASLIETQPEGFSLSVLMQTYLIDHLVESISHELLDGHVAYPRPDSLFNRYLLLDADAPMHVQANQSELLLRPILECLIDHWGFPGLTIHLQAKLESLTALDVAPPGYAQLNLHYLLLQLDGMSQTPRRRSALSIMPIEITPLPGRAQARLIQVARTLL